MTYIGYVVLAVLLPANACPLLLNYFADAGDAIYYKGSPALRAVSDAQAPQDLFVRFGQDDGILNPFMHSDTRWADTQPRYVTESPYLMFTKQECITPSGSGSALGSYAHGGLLIFANTWYVDRLDQFYARVPTPAFTCSLPMGAGFAQLGISFDILIDPKNGGDWPVSDPSTFLLLGSGGLAGCYSGHNSDFEAALTVDALAHRHGGPNR